MADDSIGRSEGRRGRRDIFAKEGSSISHPTILILRERENQKGGAFNVRRSTFNFPPAPYRSRKTSELFGIDISTTVVEGLGYL